LDSEKLNPQYNQNSVLTMPWIAWGGSRDPPPPWTPLGYGSVLYFFESYARILTYETLSYVNHTVA